MRFLVSHDHRIFLTSAVTEPSNRAEPAGCAGICWDLDILREQWSPNVLSETNAGSGLQIRIAEDAGSSARAGISGSSSAASVALPFRQFPVPWRLAVSQSGLSELELGARRENLLYGILLAVVLALMLLGVALVASIARESETTRLKSEFVHNVSHELKTPLTLIKLYGETLLDKHDLPEAQRQDCFKVITKESERLSHLINNILDFSRIDRGRREFTKRPCDLAQLVQETLDSYRYHLEKKGFTVHQEIASGLPVMEMDADAIASALINLLSNAMKSSTDRKAVIVKLYAENNDVALQVRDAGIGIAEGEIPAIFNRFYRSPNPAPGSGLGLTLVKHTTEAHGGRVLVESRIGRGSSFTLLFPLPAASRDQESCKRRS